MIVIILATLAMVSGAGIKCNVGKTDDKGVTLDDNGKWSAGETKTCSEGQQCVRQMVGGIHEQKCGGCNTDTTDACCGITLQVDGKDAEVKQFCSTTAHEDPPLDATFSSCSSNCNVTVSK